REEPIRFGFPFRGDPSGGSGSTLGSLIAVVGVMLVCALIYSWWQTPRDMRPVSKSETASAPSPEKAAPKPAPAVPAQPAAEHSPMQAPMQADSAHVRVGLSADERTWISVSSDGKNVFASALQPHETKMVEASEK